MVANEIMVESVLLTWNFLGQPHIAYLNELKIENDG